MEARRVRHFLSLDVQRIKDLDKPLPVTLVAEAAAAVTPAWPDLHGQELSAAWVGEVAATQCEVRDQVAAKCRLHVQQRVLVPDATLGGHLVALVLAKGLQEANHVAVGRP